MAAGSRVLQGKKTVLFAYSLSQGHSHQEQILSIHRGTRIMCCGTLFPLPNSQNRRTKVHEELESKEE